MIRKFLAFIVGSIVLAGCNPIDYISDQAAESASAECRSIFDEEIPRIEEEIWEVCTSFYEDVVIPTMRNELDNLIEELTTKIEELLVSAETEIMTRLGCLADTTNPSGWDCVGTFVCQ